MSLSSLKKFPCLLTLIFLVFQPISFSFALETSSQLQNDTPAPFILGSGDVLKIFVWNHKSLSFNLPINPNGKINFPLIGEIKAAGLTEAELENKIAKDLQSHIKKPQVSVTLLEVHSFRVYVLGEVIRSGQFLVKGSLTAVQAIAMAGGFTPFASKSDIIIVNQQDHRKVHFDFKDFVKQNNSQQDLFLHPGDTVIVN